MRGTNHVDMPKRKKTRAVRELEAQLDGEELQEEKLMQKRFRKDELREDSSRPQEETSAAGDSALTERVITVVFLRGVNVGGRTLKMDRLREVLARNGYPGVKTFIQSGNLLVPTISQGLKQVEEEISRIIAESFGMTISVLARSLVDLSHAATGNPFTQRSDAAELNLSRVFTAFCQRRPEAADFEKVLSVPFTLNEQLAQPPPPSRELYFYCPEGVGKSKLNSVLLERLLQTPLSCRNERTVQKMIELGREMMTQ